MTVYLRAHHLLCLLTFAGKGYSPAFVENYERLVRRLNHGEKICLVSGPDDICRPMLEDQTCHCHNESVRQRDARAVEDLRDRVPMAPDDGHGFTLGLEQVIKLRELFTDGSIRTGCQGCDWFQLCSDIAQNNFRGCRLRPPLKCPK